MNIPFDYSARHLIPVWHSFAEARKTLELHNSGERKDYSSNLNSLILDWSEQPSLALAGEIISAAATLNNKKFAEYEEARHYLENNIEPSAALRSILHKHDSPQESLNDKIDREVTEQFNVLLEDDAADTIESIWPRLDIYDRRARLREAKRLTNSQLANPIVWVDRARLYTIEGLFKKAQQCMRVALSIDPNNRFVLRAATALFAHLGDSVQAIYYLRKSSRTKIDPWLISAHIAVSSSIDRFSPFLKIGRTILDSGQISAASITELASSIATEEYKSGAVKKSRSYFTLSLKRPNENSLAQIEWVSLRDNRFPFDPSGYQLLVPHPFEAYAFDSLQNGKWEQALMYAIKWFMEVPYNRLSVLLCTYLLISFFDKYAEALIFCNSGLRIHHNDPSLLNNLIYCYVMLGRIDEASSLIKQFKSINASELNQDNEIAHYATLGLLAFRENKIAEGRILYQTALDLADTYKKKDFLGDIALINFAREIASTNQSDKDEYIAKVIKIQAEANNLHVAVASMKFLSLYNIPSSQYDN